MREMSKVPPHRCGRPGESLFEAPPVFWRLVTELLGLGPARACRSTCSRITDARNEDIAHTQNKVGVKWETRSEACARACLPPGLCCSPARAKPPTSRIAP